jgi:hypothetical protein
MREEIPRVWGIHVGERHSLADNHAYAEYCRCPRVTNTPGTRCEGDAMTTPPVDSEPPADLEDPTPATTADAKEEADDSSDTDDMGIDDEDPIDATLVGGPVDGPGSADDAPEPNPV